MAIKTICDGVTAPQETGESGIDTDSVSKYFDKHCFITESNIQERIFTLCRMGRNVKYFLKTRISEEQALEVISKANLNKIPSPIFRNAYTYKLKNIKE